MRRINLSTWWVRLALALVVAVAVLQQGTSAAPLVASGGPVDRVGVVTETVANTYTPGGANPPANTFVSLPGASIVMDVPPQSSRLFIAQYTAESACYSVAGAGSNYCQVRILIGGVEGNPAAAADFAFNSNDSGTESAGSWESLTVTRSRRIRNTGTAPLAVSIVVQRTTTSAGTSLRLDDSHLTVLRVQ